jgi:hypothetical protein
MPDAFARSGFREITVGAPPALLPRYLRAALPSVRSRPDSMPALALRLDGVRPTAAHVARYAAVVRQPPGDRLPLLYPHLLGFGLQLKLITDRAFPFPPLGLVHVSNEVTCTGPLPLGAELSVTVHAGAVRPHPRGRLVDLITAVHRDGEPVWTETSGYLHREKAPAGTGSAEAIPTLS